MRMSASIYDNLRQPGVYDELYNGTGGDKVAMRRKVLTRLRLDDLLTNDSYGQESRLVWSISDTLDGRLFTLVPPTQLAGIDFEIQCHPDIAAAAPKDVVPMLLASWIHDKHGKGTSGGFLALGETIHRRVADVLSRRSGGLNVTSLKSARKEVRALGNDAKVPSEELENLFELWEGWDSLIRSGGVVLKGWGAAASGGPALRRFLKECETNGEIPQFSLTEVGAGIFRKALALLENSQGERARPIKFLLDQIEEAEGTDKNEACVVHQLFMHYCFSAIAKANDAIPEFTVSVGKCDSALSAEDLDRIETVSDKRHPVNIDPRVVSGLGSLDASDYKTVKDESVPKIRAGIEQFKQSGGTELEKLHEAMGFLAKEIGEKAPNVEGGLFRTLSIGAAGGAAGFAVDFILDGGQPAVSTGVGSMIGGGLGSAVDKVGENLTKKHDFQLLKKSLIRTFEDELRDRTKGHITNR